MKKFVVVDIAIQYLRSNRKLKKEIDVFLKDQVVVDHNHDRDHVITGNQDDFKEPPKKRQRV